MTCKRRICLPVGAIAGIAVALISAKPADAHSNDFQRLERADKPAVVHQAPEKRQNFRARRADEFPPWEGFEDCPMAFPCVGGFIRPEPKPHE